MTATSHSAVARANFGADKMATVNAKMASVQPAIVAVTTAISRIKPWAYLVEILGISEDVAKHRIAGSRAFTADELAGLLRSKHGFEFLVAIMADHKPAWFKLCVPLMEVAEVQRMQIAARRRLRKAVEGALDADQEITAAIARAEVLSDQEFHSGQIDALRAVAGAPRGAMAAPATTQKPKR